MASRALVSQFEVQDPPAPEPPKSGSFLNPTGAEGKKAPPKEKSLGPWGEMALFAFFVLTRAIHPSIIVASKIDDPNKPGKTMYGYASGSTVILMCFFVVVFGQVMAHARGEWWSIWNKKALPIFSLNGVIYALGDWLEMRSMGSLSGASYQVLLQMKFVFTALLMMYVKGTVQTRLQWVLLTALMLSMSVYMVISTGQEGGEIPFWGMIFALLKVIISCLGAVCSDKFMKDFKDTPVHIQLVQMGMARLTCSFLLSLEPSTGIWEEGFFHGWTPVVWGVFISFIVKSVSTLYLVALLDSMLKNIGEALAVLVIYAWDVFSLHILQPKGEPGPFKVPPLLAVLVVVLIVIAYLDAKTVVDKAIKYDKSQTEKKQSNGANGHV